MSRAWRHLQRGVVAAALVLGSGVATGAPIPISADSGQNLVCTSAATVVTVPVGHDTFEWSITPGAGSCFDTGPARGTQIISYAAVGSSHGLGLCSPDGVVTDFAVFVTVTAVDTATHKARAFKEGWFAPVTTYPVAMPFMVEGPGSNNGAGVIFTHIFAQCPPGGTSSASIEWAQSL